MSQHHSISIRLLMVGCCLLAHLIHDTGIQAEDQPILIGKGVSGHVHPSICRTKDGTLIVVFKGANVQIDDQHAGTVFVNGGVHFLKVNLDRVAK